jgi:hypothetical protein
MAQVTRPDTNDVPIGLYTDGFDGAGKRGKPYFDSPGAISFQAGIVAGYSLFRSPQVQQVVHNAVEEVRFSMRAPDGTLLTGLVATLTIALCKKGQLSHNTITPTTLSDLGGGYYSMVLTAAHSNTLGLGTFLITAPGALPNVDVAIDVVAVDRNDSVRAGLTALPNASAGASGGLPALDANLNTPADLKRWLTAVPAALTTNGYVQSMLLRWLTDNSGGTPSALTSGQVAAVASGGGGPSAEDVAAAVMAFVLRSGGSDPDSTVLGHLRRMDALFFGRVIGLLGEMVQAYQPGGTTPEFSVSQNVAAGTRDEADRTASET